MAGRTEVERALLARGAALITLRSIVDVDMMFIAASSLIESKVDIKRSFGRG